MNSLARVLLLIIAVIVGALPSYGQESKTKQGLSAPVTPSPSAIESNPNAWKEYSSQRGRFTILFPGTPIEADNSSGRLEGRRFMLKTTAAYAVYYSDFPSDFPNDLEKEAALRKQFLDTARDAVVAKSNGKVLSETDIYLDGHPGRTLKIALPDGTVTRDKTYVVGKRIYQVVVVTLGELLAPDGGRFDEIRATKFLESFKLNRPENNEDGKR
jgi:hypothetical protein